VDTGSTRRNVAVHHHLKRAHEERGVILFGHSLLSVCEGYLSSVLAPCCLWRVLGSSFFLNRCFSPRGMIFELLFPLGEVSPPVSVNEVLVSPPFFSRPCLTRLSTFFQHRNASDFAYTLSVPRLFCNGLFLGGYD